MSIGLVEDTDLGAWLAGPGLNGQMWSISRDTLETWLWTDGPCSNPMTDIADAKRYYIMRYGGEANEIWLTKDAGIALASHPAYLGLIICFNHDPWPLGPKGLAKMICGLEVKIIGGLD